MNAHPEEMARIECRVDGDSRLIAGAAMIVAHVGRRAGLSSGAALELADATVQACDAVLESTTGTGPRTIRLAASELSNSIEVSVELLRGTGAGLTPQESHHLADRVQQTLKTTADGLKVEVQEELARVTLVKTCGAAKHPFAV